jgi:hypothetical protein
MARYLDISAQFFTNEGDGPLSGGKLFFYDSGAMDLKTTSSDFAMTIENTNPVVLDAYGVPGDIFFSGTAKVVLKTSADVQLRSMDPVNGV